MAKCQEVFSNGVALFVDDEGDQFMTGAVRWGTCTLTYATMRELVSEYEYEETSRLSAEMRDVQSACYMWSIIDKKELAKEKV